VKTTRGGTKFKPLFAFLVVDLDGRVNVNVHGNTYQYINGNRSGDEQPDRERQRSWKFEPARPSQDDRANGKQRHRQRSGNECPRCYFCAPEMTSLTLDKTLDGHGTGRLVTAYTKRLTPMRSAASCSAGES